GSTGTPIRRGRCPRPPPATTSPTWRRSCGPEVRSVPAVGLRVGPGVAGAAVRVLDVVQPPLDLGDRVGAPVRSVLGHPVARERLRDAVRARGRVVGVVLPARLAGP